MEDDKSLDLSLGLQPCAGGADSVKGKSIALLDEVDRDVKLINDFKNFLEGGTVKHDPGPGSQRIGPIKTEENFFNNLSQTPHDVDSSKRVDGEKGACVGEKRKSLLSEASQPKKVESNGHPSDLHDKTKVSHISITTDEGSTADNEDVADSEALGSSSQFTRRDDGSKICPGSSGPSSIHKEFHRIPDCGTSSAEVSGQKMFTISSEKEAKVVGMSNVQPFQAQTGTMMNLPYSVVRKDNNTAGTSSTSNYQLPSMMHTMAASNTERGSQPVFSANMPLMFGYPTVQLPTLDKDNSTAVASIQHQFHPSYGDRVQIGSDKHNDYIKMAQASTPVISRKSSEAALFDARGGDNLRENVKQTNPVEGPVSRKEDEAKGNNTVFHSTPSDQPRPDSIPSEYPDIRPGIAADIKFGGSSSYPNLPWVSTTGPGPNGRTISGVTYRFSDTQIKIVCACHGSHMSPEEFVRHASEGRPHPDVDTSTSTVPSSNPAASAKS